MNDLPNFYLIGAAKSGTTTLYSVLQNHPHVFLTSPKSPNFFLAEHMYTRGLSWYLDTYYRDAVDYKIRGEASPGYLAHAAIVAPRIHHHLGEFPMQFLAILRNPIDRAYSHYWYNVARKGIEDLTFAEALDAEGQREQDLRNGRRSRHELSPTQLYFKNGIYAENLGIFFKYFPREQFHLILAEDLTPDHFGVTGERLCHFLGIEQSESGHQHKNPYREVNQHSRVKRLRKKVGSLEFLNRLIPEKHLRTLRNSYWKLITQRADYPPMDTAIRRELIERYRPDILALQGILERDLGHWLQ